MAEVTIYSTGVCPYCVQAKQLIKMKGANFNEVRVDLHPDKMEEMLSKSNNQKTVPQIFIDDFHVGGFTELRQLNADGKLDGLLGL